MIIDNIKNKFPSIKAPLGFRFEIIDETHSDSIIKWRNDPTINKNFISKNIITKDSQKTFLNNYNNLDRLDLVLINIDTNSPIGIFSIKNLSHRPEIGKIIGEKEFLGKGIAKKATMELIKFVFEQLDIITIYAITQKSNLVNISLNRKIGFEIVEEQLIEGNSYYLMRLEKEDFLYTNN